MTNVVINQEVPISDSIINPTRKIEISLISKTVVKEKKDDGDVIYFLITFI